MVIFTSKHETIVLTESPFASGGEGAIYNVVSAPSYLKNVCVKIYHSRVLNKQREDRIKYMVANPPSQIRGDGFMLGWPIDYVTDENGKFLGFVMPLGFPESKELVTLTSTTLSKKLGQEWKERYDRSLGKKALLSRLKLICNIAIPVHILHSTGKYVLKDFKPQNVLATADGRITICDMDSIQIAEGGKLLFSGTAATPDYIPPEFYSKGIGKKPSDIISESWDTFSMGVVFYQLLFGIHPYVITPKEEQEDGANSISSNISSGLFPFGANGDMVKIRPKLHDKFMLLPQELQDMFVQTFSDNEKERPTAEEWGIYIHKIVKSSDVDTFEGNTDIDINSGTQPSNGINNTNLWIILLLVIGAIIGGVILFNSDSDSSSEPSIGSSEIDFYSEKENTVETPIETPIETEEEFATYRYTKSTDNISDEWGIEMKIDYPTSGNAELVSSIRNWINKTMKNITSVNQYDYDMDDGNRFIDYYYSEVISGKNDMKYLDIEIFKEYETDSYVTYQFEHEYYSGGAHGGGDDGGATFRKSDGKIIDWGMFTNDSKMQELIKAGLDEYFEGDFEVDSTPLPKGNPILLRNGVRFIYGTWEIEGTAYVHGRPQFTIPYTELKYNMNSDLRELID